MPSFEMKSVRDGIEGHSATTNDTGSSDDPSQFISSRSMTVLSRAAKRNVCKQQQLISKSSLLSRISPRREFKTQQSERILGRRSLTSSAPPAVCQLPIIVIDEASSRVSDDFSSRKSSKLIQCNSAPPGTEPDKHLSDYRFHTRKTPSPDHYATDEDYAIRLTRPAYKSSSKRFTPTPPSQPSSTDWSWVRSRLFSHESKKRPDSSMTFDDFLEGLDLDSDEYDTDLEDTFFVEDADPYDSTGIWHYQNMCRIKGVTPAKQVLEKLQNKRAHFKLTHRYINSKDTAALASGLKRSMFVQELDLSDNCMNSKGVKHVANMMRNNIHIQRLDLSNNCLCNDAGRYIAQRMTDNHCLTHLCLSRNKLGDEEALFLSEMLLCNHSLKSLDFSHNHFGDNAGEAFAAALMEDKDITSFNLSWNTLHIRAAAAIAKALNVNTTLLSLDLSWNGLGDEGAALIGSCFQDNSTLRYLSLAVNHIGIFGSEKLATGVTGIVASKTKRKRPKTGKTKCALNFLNLDRNPLGSKAVQALLKKLEMGDKLNTLSIKEVLLNNETLTHIDRFLRTKNSSSTLLYEGQKYLEQSKAEMFRGMHVLNEALVDKGIRVIDIVKAMDKEGYGLNTTDLRNTLCDYVTSVTELELEYAIQNIDSNNDGIIHYKDLVSYAKLI